jgi:hypothetical protein
MGVDAAPDVGPQLMHLDQKADCLGRLAVAVQHVEVAVYGQDIAGPHLFETHSHRQRQKDIGRRRSHRNQARDDGVVTISREDAACEGQFLWIGPAGIGPELRLVVELAETP